MSKAVDTFRRTNNDPLHFPTVVTISLYTRSKAVSQADGKLTTILLSKICPKIQIEITFSITLDKKEWFETGLYFLTFPSQDLASKSKVSQ